MKKLFRVMLVFLAVAFVLVACGSDSDSYNGENDENREINNIIINGDDTNDYPPTTESPEETLPPTPVIEMFTRESVIVGENGDWPLPGELTLPYGAGTGRFEGGMVPAVVLVHGSGAHDMNSTIGEGRPFYDIATFLSNNGIAVLRYDKRNYAHADALMAMAQTDLAAFGSITVWDETIEDALLAAELLRADPRIDPDRIYLLGHSLGAMLAPRIQNAAVERGFEFAGLILMAASPRELTEVILEQLDANLEAAVERLPLFEGDDLILAQEEIAAAEIEVEFLREVAAMIWETPPDIAREMFFFGASFYYFQDLASPTFAESIANITAPILTMQAERDFQVLHDIDGVMLNRIFVQYHHGYVTSVYYGDLNHRFSPSTATNQIEHALEIMLSPEPVSNGVLQHIVDWIRVKPFEDWNNQP